MKGKPSVCDYVLSYSQAPGKMGAMRVKRSWEEINIGKRPLCYCGLPAANIAPSSFPWFTLDFWSQFQQSKEHGTARLYYRHGWTAVIFWNRDIYFVDEILTFESIIDLIRERHEPMYLQMKIRRDYGEAVA